VALLRTYLATRFALAWSWSRLGQSLGRGSGAEADLAAQMLRLVWQREDD
jgi:hypothetical protein